MNKVVYDNSLCGCFSLSVAAMKWLAENGREEIKAIVKKELRKHPNKEFGYFGFDIKRHDPDLVRCIETLGRSANGRCSELKVRELKGNLYRIDYDVNDREYVIEPEDEEYVIIE